MTRQMANDGYTWISENSCIDKPTRNNTANPLESKLKRKYEFQRIFSLF